MKMEYIVVLICMMLILPSISALQAESKIVEKPEDQKLPKHFPLLYLFVWSVAYFRLTRGLAWSLLAINGHDWNGPTYNENSFAFKRAMFLLERADNWAKLWERFGERVSWW